MEAAQGTSTKHTLADDDAVMGSIRSASLGADGGLGDLDAVSGASLGVEGIIERGRQALQASRR